MQSDKLGGVTSKEVIRIKVLKVTDEESGGKKNSGLEQENLNDPIKLTEGSQN